MMVESTSVLADAGVEAFVQQLAAFRDTLSSGERRMLDAMLVAAAAGPADDVEAYGLTHLAAKHVAMATLLALGLSASVLSPTTGSTALAAPVDQQSSTVTPGNTLGFSLRNTTMHEQLQRHGEGAERGLTWSTEFVSRWELNEGQLDRWSAQAIGFIVDGLGGDVRLGGFERLDARDVGEQRVAYRYALTTGDGAQVGEATIVVFARGDRVGMTGTGAIGSRTPVDAAALARLLDTTRA